MTSDTMRYQRDSRGLAALLVHPEMGRAMMTMASAGERVFETIAPRDTNVYAASLVKSPATSLLPSPRAAVHLAAEVSYAAQVERVRGTLGKVADVIGSAKGA